jgi:hypothetical protein
MKKKLSARGEMNFVPYHFDFDLQIQMGKIHFHTTDISV